MTSASGNNALATLERALPAATRARILRHAPFLLLLGLLILCAFLAARLSWQFAAPGVAVAPLASGSDATGAATGAVETPADRIVAAHLFGRSDAPAASVAARNAPETSLDLTLAGVAADNQGKLSYAIITGGGQGNDTYAVGATLPGGALIRAILPDRVVIAHDGRLETLRLPWADLPASVAAAKPESESAQPPVVTQNVRNRLRQNPRSLGDYLRVRPYSKDGHFVGFRVYPGTKPELFRKAGLLPGDIVTSVNGITLTNTPANIAKAMKEINQAKRLVRLGILRQGHSIVVTINSGG